MPSPLLLLLLLPPSSPSPGWQRNLHLVQSVTPTQRVEAGSSLQVECGLGLLPPGSDLAWVKLGRGGEETLLSYWSQEDGVEDFWPGLEARTEGGTWSLGLKDVTRDSTGFYECQVAHGGVWPLHMSLSYRSLKVPSAAIVTQKLCW